MTLSELVCTLQDLAHQGYAMYEVDKENEIVLLKSREKDDTIQQR